MPRVSTKVGFRCTNPAGCTGFMFVVSDDHPDDGKRWSRRRECPVCGGRQSTTERPVGQFEKSLFNDSDIENELVYG